VLWSNGQGYGWPEATTGILASGTTQSLHPQVPFLALPFVYVALALSGRRTPHAVPQIAGNAGKSHWFRSKAGDVIRPPTMDLGSRPIVAAISLSEATVADLAHGR
jgi:hypothetical protein